MNRRLRLAMLTAAALVVAITELAFKTRSELRPVPVSLDRITATATVTQILDRNGMPLNVTFENDWNVHDIVPLHDMPALLKDAFIHAEDKRFYSHGGPDWLARMSALVTNVKNLRAIRGASTISEQVIRMLNARPRTVWTRWLEGFEAARLERFFSKDAILEFYMNQVPYTANRRGVRQAASYYFARDLETLSRREMLALAVLIRSPSRMDLYRSIDESDGAIVRLADAMLERGALTAAERDAILAEALTLEAPRLPVSAPHFLRYVRSRLDPSSAANPKTITTLDAGLQLDVQRLLDQRLEYLRDLNVEHGAVLIADNATGEVLVWAVAGGGDAGGPRSYIDAVTTPRQPGSALKPFLYALALETGWTAAEIIDDAPLAEDVGTGLHNYRNYSQRFYGLVTLRDALGNSLNIPALKTLHHIGAERYLDRLRTLGFTGLDEHPAVYGDGIALGNGAVTLYELVQAYTALANRGLFRPLRVLLRDDALRAERTVYSSEATSLIANILSDPEARSIEFGRNSVLNLPVQTAVKTGTSSDFRDAWAVGFDSRYTVGVWMGNLDQEPTVGVTGSIGPALLLRSVFAELARRAEPEPLYLSPRLTRRTVCVPVPSAPLGECLERAEWFLPGTGPAADAVEPQRRAPIRIRQPTPGLQLALDPRLPPDAQAFEFLVDGVAPGDEVLWMIDDQMHRDNDGSLLWQVSRGRHDVQATVRRGGATVAQLDRFAFSVK